MNVRVVPLRRLPTDRDWLEYAWTLSTPPQVGQLVRIPLRASNILGIVWELSSVSTIERPKPVTEVVLNEPILSDWQRRVMSVMAETGAASLAGIAWSSTPRLALRTWKHVQFTVNTTPVESKDTIERLWYRQRSTGIEAIRHWADQRRERQRCILVPTIDDAHDLAHVFQHDNHQVLVVSSEMSAGQLLEAWQSVRRGQPIVVIGTLRALVLPWTQPPALYLDQQEHHAHKHTASHPRLDTRVILDQLAVPYSWSSPAPTLTVVHHDPQLQPDHQPTNRRCVNLNRETGWHWLSDETQLAIDHALDQGQRILCIAPRGGYARTMMCRHCQHVVRCPSCQRPASIIRGLHQQGRCAVCRQDVPLNVTCPNCQGTSWQWRGFGVEQMVDVIRQRWPDTTVAPVFRADTGSQVSVDTYSAYRQLSSVHDIGLVVVVHGDAVLQYPDYSAAERAWQYLSRLASLTTAPVLVQTWQPEQAFWQRWLHGDDRAWYAQEYTIRQQLRLPPTVTQWILRYRGQVEIAKQHLADCQRAYPGLSFSQVPSNRGTYRAVLTIPEGIVVNWKQRFPTPWQIDRYPTSWLD